MGALVATARRQAGVTLAEMVTVVAVLAVAASLAIPKADPQAAFGAESVAGEIARAVRFAQREAVRTGTYQQVGMAPASEELEVYQPSGTGRITATHPVDKRPYKISFAGNAMPRATIVSAVFKYEDKTTTSFASFGPDGSPAYSSAKGNEPLTEEGRITLRYGNVERVVKIAPVTGRVSF